MNNALTSLWIECTYTFIPGEKSVIEIGGDGGPQLSFTQKDKRLIEAFMGHEQFWLYSSTINKLSKAGIEELLETLWQDDLVLSKEENGTNYTQNEKYFIKELKQRWTEMNEKDFICFIRFAEGGIPQ